MVKFAAVMILGLVVSTVAVSAKGLPAGTSWKNQRGSVLTINSSDAKGAFKGSYENNAPGFGCHDKFDASGTVHGATVIFYVTFKNATQSCDTVTIWRGTVK